VIRPEAELVRRLLQQRDELRQQVGPDRRQRAERERAFELVLVGLGDVLDGRGLLEHARGHRHDLVAERRRQDLLLAALEEDAELVLELLDRMDSVGWLTGQRSAARPKCCSWASATM